MSWHESALRPPSICVIAQVALLPLRGLKRSDAVLKQFALPGLKDALDKIENVWLRSSPYVAGEEVSIADLLIATELDLLQVCIEEPFTYAKLIETRPKVVEYLARVKQACAPYYEQNLEPVLAFRAVVERRRSKV